MLNELANNAGTLIGLAYTAAMLGHILYKGFIRRTHAHRGAK